MTITELIAKLQDMRDLHGDLEVGFLDTEYGDSCAIDTLDLTERDEEFRQVGSMASFHLGPKWIKLS